MRTSFFSRTLQPISILLSMIVQVFNDRSSIQSFGISTVKYWYYQILSQDLLTQSTQSMFTLYRLKGRIVVTILRST